MKITSQQMSALSRIFAQSDSFLSIRLSQLVDEDKKSELIEKQKENDQLFDEILKMYTDDLTAED